MQIANCPKKKELIFFVQLLLFCEEHNEMIGLKGSVYLSIHGTHVTANNSTNNKVFFLASDQNGIL